MIEVTLKNLCVDFPLHSIESRSIRHHFLKALTGGAITSSKNKLLQVRALDNINLYFKEGDRICLLGHNGSGKSTLLRVISKIYPPSEGILNVNGRVSSMIDPTLGMDHEASGIENIYLRALFLDVKKNEVMKKIDEIIAFSELGDYIYLPVRTYSSGMVMRLSFAISTAFKPEILVLDEWLSVGDTRFRVKATERLNKFVQSAGLLILATNDEDLAKNIATRIIRLDHGIIVDDKFIT